MTKYINDALIQLEPMPGALLAELFTGGVVIIPQEFTVNPRSSTTIITVETEKQAIPKNPETASATLPALPVLSWLGNFGKRVLVVVNDPSALHINDKDYELLTKILGSVGLSAADIALVNAARYTLEYNQLQEKLPAAVGLYFGIEPVDIGAPIKFPLFQVQPWNNTKFLYAPSLSELNGTSPEAISLKKELWVALKKIFN